MDCSAKTVLIQTRIDDEELIFSSGRHVNIDISFETMKALIQSLHNALKCPSEYLDEREPFHKPAGGTEMSSSCVSSLRAVMATAKPISASYAFSMRLLNLLATTWLDPLLPVSLLIVVLRFSKQGIAVVTKKALVRSIYTRVP